jgi:hypothetical protein
MWTMMRRGSRLWLKKSEILLVSSDEVIFGEVEEETEIVFELWMFGLLEITLKRFFKTLKQKFKIKILCFLLSSQSKFLFQHIMNEATDDKNKKHVKCEMKQTDSFFLQWYCTFQLQKYASSPKFCSQNFRAYKMNF